MQTPIDQCQHDDIQPIQGNEDWGRCVKCEEDGFPITDRAAYGETKCSACHDTGLVPVNVDGQTVTRKDGTTYVLAGALADARCQHCPAGMPESEPFPCPCPDDVAMVSIEKWGCPGFQCEGCHATWTDGEIEMATGNRPDRTPPPWTPNDV